MPLVLPQRFRELWRQTLGGSYSKFWAVGAERKPALRSFFHYGNRGRLAQMSTASSVTGADSAELAL